MVIRQCGHWLAKTMIADLLYLYLLPSFWITLSKQAELQFLCLQVSG